MDVTPHLREILPAPTAVFRHLAERAERPRFMLPEGGGWRAVTWAAFAGAIREVAAFLAEDGFRPGDRGAVFAPNRVEWLEAAYGVQAAGGVMVPVYPASTAEQAAYVLEHSDAKVLFVDTQPLLERILGAWSALSGVRRIVCLDDALDVPAAAERLAERGARVPAFSELEQRIVSWSRVRAAGARADLASPGAFEARLSAVRLEDPGVMLYTSGTTGHPKGVPLTHHNVGVNTRDWLVALGELIDEDAVDLLWLPFSHIFGFGEVGIGNLLGFTTYMTTPKEVLGLMPSVKPSVFMSVPSYWEKLATLAAEGAPDGRAARLLELTGGRLRFCLSGGAGLKREVKELFHQAGLLIIEGYGLTETAPTLTLNRPRDFRFDSVGKPLDSVELRLAEDGEILARGPNVFLGYHKDPVATQAAFTPDGWFKTGDVGRFTEDGFLQIIDRKKEILVTAGGKNVPPANIELRFRDDPFIAHVVVYGDGKSYLVAGVWLDRAAVDAHLEATGVAKSAAGAAIEALVAERVAAVNTQLASYETIKRWKVFEAPLTVENGLLTATLKVRRKKVYEAFGEALEALYGG